MKTTFYSFVASFSVLLMGCNTPKTAHERRLKQAEYEHKERLQQIRHAVEEAKEVKAARDTGVQIAPPPSAANQAQPTVGPARQGGQPLWVDGAGVTRLRPNRYSGIYQSGQPLWVDGVGVKRLLPNRYFGSGPVEFRRPQPLTVNRVGVTRLAPARPNR